MTIICMYTYLLCSLHMHIGIPWLYERRSKFTKTEKEKEKERLRSLSFAYMTEESDSDDSSTVRQHHLPWLSKS